MIKEILHMMNTSAAVQYQFYVLKSGDTDLTAVASDTTLMARAYAEAKNVYPISDETTSGTSVAPSVLARNTVLSAGDALKIWVMYGAVQPDTTTVWVSVSGDTS